MNVTALNMTANGVVSLRPGGGAVDVDVDFAVGDTTPNAATVTLLTSGGFAGQINITYDGYGQPGTTDLLIDVVGYTTNSGL